VTPATRVIFFGTPDLAVPFLEVLAQDPQIQISLVVTKPDKPVGRKQLLTPSPIKQAAARLAIPIFQPPSLRSDKAAERLRAELADVFVVVAYGKMIPESILRIPPRGCVNVHPSLLPAHRGPSPLSAAILHGDQESGVTIMLLDTGMDTGPILGKQTIFLDACETQNTLTQKVMREGPTLLRDVLQRYLAGTITPTPQDEARATFTTLWSREDGRIDWSLSAERIDRMIRAYHPWPGTWTIWKRSNKAIRLKILSAHPSGEHVRAAAGAVTEKNGHLLMGCGDGIMEIDTLQPEGSSPMSGEAFLRGYSDVMGAELA
jgi:methionyl-tRNA formyltransferase